EPPICGPTANDRQAEVKYCYSCLLTSVFRFIFYSFIKKNMESLSGKNALVTGAGKGIGRAIAIALAKEGVNVALLSRTSSDLQAVADEVENEGVKAVILTADVSNIDAVNAAVDSAFASLGSIDILINNAGIAAFGGFLDLEPSTWEKIIQVNLMGPYYTTR